MYVQSGLKMFRSGESYKEAQKDAMLTLRKVTGELANSTFAEQAGGNRIVLPSEPDMLVVFPSADDLTTNSDPQLWVHDNSSGELLWRKWVLFSIDRNQKILNKYEQKMSGQARENLPVPPAGSDFSGKPQSYGRNISDMKLNWLELGDLMEVVLWTETPPQTGTREGTRIELRTSVRIEN